MFPVLPPGGVDPGPARSGPAPAVAATQPVVGVQPLVPVDPQNPRAAAQPVNADAADAARVKAELAKAAVAGGGGAAAAQLAVPTNRAAAVAPQLTLLLQQLQALGVADAGEGAPPVVSWPQAGQPVADEPATALLRRGELTGVYVVTARGEGQAEGFALRAVRTGASHGVGVEVLAGLKAGDRVALDPVRAGLARARPQ